MKTPVSLLFILPIVVSGCATRSVEVAQSAPARRVATLPNENGIRYGETVEAYSIGRYVDPNSPGIMHEGHTVYRIATTPRWNLRCNAPATTPLRDRPVHRDIAFSPAPVNDELVAEINRQKAISREMTQQSERLNQYLQNLRGSLDASKAVAEQNLGLKQQLAQTQSRIAELERKLEQQTKGAASAPTPGHVIAKKDSDGW